MGSLTYVLRDVNTAVGIPGQDVKIRIGPGFVIDADTHTFSDVTGKPGAYKITDSSVIKTGFYKAYVNGVEDESFGGPNGREIIRGSDLVMKTGGTMTGDLNMGGNKMKALPDPIDNDEPATKGYSLGIFLPLSAAAAFVDLGSAQTITAEKIFNNIKIAQLRQHLSTAGWRVTGYTGSDSDVASTLMNKGWIEGKFITIANANGTFLKISSSVAQQIFSDLVFKKDPPFFMKDPTHLLHGTNKRYLESYVGKILSGIASGSINAFQQSGNIRRVIPNGTQEDHKVYTTVGAAKTDAEESAGVFEMINIILEGSGTDEIVPTNWNLLPAEPLAEYVNYSAVSRLIIMRVAEDNYVGGDPINRPIISTLTVDNENEDAVTGFKDVIFKGTMFTNKYNNGSGAYNFENVHFEDIPIMHNVQYSFNSDCSGVIYDSILKKFIFLNNIEQKRVQGKFGGTMAVASTLTLGDGNYWFLTGGGTLSFINNTGWEINSEITLELDSSTTIEHAQLGIGDQAGFIMKSGSDYTGIGYKVFFLNRQKTHWIEK